MPFFDSPEEQFDSVLPDLAAKLKSEWNKQRGELTGNKYYRVSKDYLKYFTAAAEIVRKHGLDPAEYVAAQLRFKANALQIHPSILTGPGALERVASYRAVNVPVRRARYVADMNKVKVLQKLGKTPEEICTGSYDLSPLVVWVLLRMGKRDAAEVQEDASSEARRNFDIVEDMFGPLMKELLHG